MEGNDMINITVLIGGRPYPLKIKSADEPAIREIVKEVNEKVNRFQQNYAKKDKQDCLAMALLTYAVDLHKNAQETGPADNDDVSEKVLQLDNLLDDLLK